MYQSDATQWFDELQQKRRKLAEQLKDPAAQGLWKSVVDKYSDNAHFVYELLQNSDDAKASVVRVYFDGDEIEFIHNGVVPFTISDPSKEVYAERSSWGHINALTSIGASNKVEEQQIGKFGIGFKSVFKYVDTPHVEDDEFSFDIEDYIVPVLKERRSSRRKKGETSFILPLRNSFDKEKNTTLNVIKQKFDLLHFPLLFLPNLEEIKLFKDDEEYSSYSKEKINSQILDDVICYEFSLSEPNQKIVRCRLFEKKISSEKDLKISCCYFFDENGNWLPEKALEEPLFCFFPTLQKLRFPYILNAPFRLTESRESLVKNDEWNERMADELGNLVVSATEFIVKHVPLNIVLISSVHLMFPNVKEVCSHKNEFEKIHVEAIQKRLQTAKIFLSKDEKWVDVNHLVVADSASFLFLLNDELIHKKWSVTANKTLLNLLYVVDDDRFNEFQLFLKDYNLSVSCVKGEDFVLHLMKEDVEGMSLESVEKLYSYLANISKKNTEIANCLKKKNIFFGEDGVCYGAKEVFFSSGVTGNYPIINSFFVENRNVMRFFERMGVSKPGALIEILQYVLPAYGKGEVSVNDEEKNAEHIRFIFHYVQSLSLLDDDRRDFCDVLSNIRILRVKTIDGGVQYAAPKETYHRTTDLVDFLFDCPSTCFFDNEWIVKNILPEERDDFYSFLSNIGVHFGLNIKEVRRNKNSRYYYDLDLHPVSLRTMDDGAQEILDKDIEGASPEQWTERKSVAFFNLLNKSVQRLTTYLFNVSLEGTYRYIQKGKRNYTEEVIYHTTAKSIIYHSPWLKSADGQWVSPEMVKQTSQLAPIYNLTAVDLLFMLGIQNVKIPTNLTVEEQGFVSFALQCKSDGMSLKDFQNAIDSWKKKEKSPI